MDQLGAISELVPYKCMICKERLKPMFHDDMVFLSGIVLVLYIIDTCLYIYIYIYIYWWQTVHSL